MPNHRVKKGQKGYYSKKKSAKSTFTGGKVL